MTQPTEEEMDTQGNRAAFVMDSEGTRLRNMTYEEGVNDALQWMRGFSSEPPLNDELYGDTDGEG